MSLLKLKTLRIGLKRKKKMQTKNPAICGLKRHDTPKNNLKD